MFDARHKKAIHYLRILLVASCFSLSACHLVVLDFSRETSVNRGDIAGQATRAEQPDVPAAFSVVNGHGMRVLQTSNIDGFFRIRDIGTGDWVLAVGEDQDGDGVFENTGFSYASLSLNVHNDGYTLQEAGPDRVGVLLGDISLTPTRSVAGDMIVTWRGVTGPPSDHGLVGRIFAYAEISISSEEGSESAIFTMPADGQAGVQADGAFEVKGVGHGSYRVVAALYSSIPGSHKLGELIHMSAAESIEEEGAVNMATPFEVVLSDPLTPLGTRPIAIRFQPGPADRVYFIFVPPGETTPSCAEEPWDAVAGDPVFEAFPYAIPSASIEGGATVQVDAPVGVWDILACEEVTGFADQPHLFSQVVPPTSNNATELYLTSPLFFEAKRPCLGIESAAGPSFNSADSLLDSLTASEETSPVDGEAVEIVDCDQDGLRALPTLPAVGAVPEADLALWQACVETCSKFYGAALARVQCGVAGQDEKYDCDDDGDGQPDVTEPVACYGLGKGGDRDGDGLCRVFDPFPGCASNDPDLCQSGQTDMTPQVPALFLGDTITSDAGTSDAGVESDAGPNADQNDGGA
jgi:hypothetical protein